MAELQPEIVTDKSEPGKIGVRQAGSPETHWMDEADFRSDIKQRSQQSQDRESLLKEVAVNVDAAKVDIDTASIDIIKAAAAKPVKVAAAAGDDVAGEGV